MLTMNLLVTTMASFNKVDEYLRHHPNRSNLISLGLKSRKFNHHKYLDDIHTFDVGRYWTDLGHQAENLNPDSNDDEEENDSDEDEV